jgi:hypothetical protein
LRGRVFQPRVWGVLRNKEEIIGHSKIFDGLVGESLQEQAEELAERREKCKIELKRNSILKLKEQHDC